MIRKQMEAASGQSRGTPVLMRAKRRQAAACGEGEAGRAWASSALCRSRGDRGRSSWGWWHKTRGL